MPEHGLGILLCLTWPPPLYPKALSLVEEHLCQEVACSSRDFFAAVHAIPGVNATHLAKVDAFFFGRSTSGQRQP